MKPVQQNLPMEIETKQGWRAVSGTLQAYKVCLGARGCVYVAAYDPNDAKVVAVPALRSALGRNTTEAERERIAQYIELKVTRQPDLDDQATSRGEIIP